MLESMIEALQRFEARGFRDDLRAEGHRLRAVKSGRRFLPAELVVVETARFEGITDPDDEAIVLALATVDGEPVGTYTVPFGAAISRADAEILPELPELPESREPREVPGPSG
ncbi:MAG: hypothetical protein M5U14_06245 [Acidimicrobiia bacterium]|nr:hypothetical protein [Acidimicrobiia bacterium]